LFIVTLNLTTSQAAILFQLYYDVKDLNQMNAEDEDDFLYHFATEVQTQI